MSRFIFPLIRDHSVEPLHQQFNVVGWPLTNCYLCWIEIDPPGNGKYIRGVSRSLSKHQDKVPPTPSLFSVQAEVLRVELRLCETSTSFVTRVTEHEVVFLTHTLCTEVSTR